MIYIWILIFAASIVAEAFLLRSARAILAPALLTALILELFGVAWWIQIIVFCPLAALSIGLFVCFGKPLLKKKDARSNINAIVGEKCVVTERIENMAGIGQVEVNGMYWAARAVQETVIYEVGQQLSVVAVEGVKLIVKE